MILKDVIAAWTKVMKLRPLDVNKGVGLKLLIAFFTTMGQKFIGEYSEKMAYNMCSSFC